VACKVGSRVFLVRGACFNELGEFSIKIELSKSWVTLLERGVSFVLFTGRIFLRLRAFAGSCLPFAVAAC
jgi:hypothetical protein